MTTFVPTAVLVLNIDFTPLNVISWRGAMEKLLSGKVQLVQDYAGRTLSSATESFPYPAVVRVISRYVKRKVRLNRQNVLARDDYTCQYCGAKPRNKSGKPRLEDLTIDHVIPRAQAKDGHVKVPGVKRKCRVTSWRNLATACYGCNSTKGPQTPRQAGMKLLKKPWVPTTVDVARMTIFKYRIPDEWSFYLPEGSPWRSYWTAELID